MTHVPRAVKIAPCCAACWIVENMLKARPNQTMPNRSMNTKGSTSAASAISAPSVLSSLLAIRLIFSTLQIPRFARDDKS